MRYPQQQLLLVFTAGCLFAMFGSSHLLGQGGLTLDFNTDPEELGVIFFGNAEWRDEGGVDNSGYLKVTDAENGQSGAILLPDLSDPPGSALESFQIKADLRVGAGTDSPADGFSFNLVRPDDPLAAGELTYAGIGSEASLPEEGSRTGLGIGFDEWQSGARADDAADAAAAPPFGSCGTDLTRDCIGISVRVDGELLAQVPFLTLNGALEDQSSLQTGPQGDAEDLGWAELVIQVTPSITNPETENNLFISYKGREVFNDSIVYQTSPGQLVFGGRTGGANSNHHIDNISIITDFTGGVTGDFNGDGTIDMADFNILVSNMHTSGLDISLADGDIDFNRRINLADFVEFRKAFLAANPQGGGALAAVPEPNSIALLLLAIVGFARTRRYRKVV